MAAFDVSQSFVSQTITAQSTLQDSMQSAETEWRALRQPVALTTLTVLLLSWLLMFIDCDRRGRGPRAGDRAGQAARARADRHPDHGSGRARPGPARGLAAGVLTGAAAAAQLGKIVLVPGTPNPLPLTAWTAAAAPSRGGLAAVVMAAQRGLRRGVVAQFRRPAVLAAGRGWVIDSVLITASVAGLIEVLSLQRAGATQQGALVLLVPGLLGLAVAVVASRLLPLGCRALYGLASRCRALAAYLALAAHRPPQRRCADDYRAGDHVLNGRICLRGLVGGPAQLPLVAQTQVGAADVLTVEVPAGQNLGAIVAKADPSGRLATAVDSYDGTLAVDPARFARIAYWPRHSAAAIRRRTGAACPSDRAHRRRPAGDRRCRLDVHPPRPALRERDHWLPRRWRWAACRPTGRRRLPAR